MLETIQPIVTGALSTAVDTADADPSLATSTALIGLAIVLTYYIIVWAVVGNRRPTSERNLRPMPPTDLAPAALRHVMRMGYDEKTLGAALLSMAVKGYVYIEETDTGWAVIRDEAGSHVLSREEHILARYMFRGRERFELSWSNRRRVASLQRKLRGALEHEYGKTYYRSNTVWRITGLTISTFVFVAMMVALWRSGMWGTPGSAIVDFFLGAIVAIAGPLLVYREYKRSRVSGPMRYPALMSAVGAICCILGCGVMIDSMASVYESGLTVALGALVCIVAANSLFVRLLPRYTRKGWGIVREARGFLRNLTSAKGEVETPDEGQRLFEVFLPYAAALDHESEWADVFTNVIDTGPKAQRESAGYAPVWYSGRRWGRQSPPEFVAEVVQGLTDAVSSSGAPTRREPGMLRAIRGRAEQLTHNDHDD